ncbi:DUF4124 domain-containing protein, partial [Marinobacter sp.]|uniref:DUF4124 domain-containing protein n=1 Tax=Marinobacter sp. TaxID=50741 RepID=UPI002B4760FB
MPGRRWVFLCLFLLAQPAAAEMYTWTDDQGVTHFSDTAPATAKAKTVTPRNASVIPMADNVRQSEKVSAIHRKIQQSLQRDTPEQRFRSSEGAPDAEKQCSKLKLRIEKIQQKLRAGYSGNRGNSLRRQR